MVRSWWYLPILENAKCVMVHKFETVFDFDDLLFIDVNECSNIFRYSSKYLYVNFRRYAQ